MGYKVPFPVHVTAHQSGNIFVVTFCSGGLWLLGGGLWGRVIWGKSGLVGCCGVVGCCGRLWIVVVGVCRNCNGGDMWVLRVYRVVVQEKRSCSG